MILERISPHELEELERRLEAVAAFAIGTGLRIALELAADLVPELPSSWPGLAGHVLDHEAASSSR